MNKVITRNVELRASTPELIANRQAEFVISSEAVDSYNTVFRSDGWQLDSYLKNPIVTYNHSLYSANPDSIIGTSEVFFDGDKLIGRVTFEDEKINPVAEKVRKKVEAGTLRMASVGAHIIDADFGDKDKGEDPNVLFFNKHELVEWSIVPAGANPDAHKRNTEAVEAYKKEIIKNIEVQPEVVAPEGRSVFEAQLIINQNKVK